MNPCLKRDFVTNGYVIAKRVVPNWLAEKIAQRTDDEYGKWQPRMFPTETNSGGIFLPDWDEVFLLQDFVKASGLVDEILGDSTEWFATTVVLEPQHESAWPLGKMHIDRPPTTDPTRQWPSFSLSVGIGIRGGDVSMSGSLGVFPGSHLACQRYFRLHANKTLWSCLTGEFHPTTRRPKVELPFMKNCESLVEVFLEPGDVVCSHSLLTHTSMPNLTRVRRISSYFAFIHPRHREIGNEFVRSIWDYFPQSVKEIAYQENCVS